jgi:type II secretory pathway pseudopilin PulG
MFFCGNHVVFGFLKLKGLSMCKRKKCRGEYGFSLMELVIVLGILGALVVSIMSWRASASREAKVHELSQSLVVLASGIQRAYNGQYSSINVGDVIKLGLVKPPLVVSGNNVKDDAGQSVQVTTNATEVFTITISTTDNDRCNLIAQTMSGFAPKFEIGSTIVLDKMSGSQTSANTTNIATGCSASGTKSLKFTFN